MTEVGLSVGRILVVDDEETIRSTFEDYFVANGYYVVTAIDGEDALQKFVPGEFDCVISDLRMPKIDGLELLKRIKLLDADVSFLVITGFPGIDNLISALKEGAFAYLIKPFHMEDIQLKVEQALNIRKPDTSLKKSRV